MNTAQILLGSKEETDKIVLTGIRSLDDSMGGLRGGNTYLLAGLEKSGKTSLLLNWVSSILKEKRKITYISTEMSYKELVGRLATIRGISIDFDNPSEKKLLHQEIEEYLTFVGIDDLLEEGGISVKKTASTVEKNIWDGGEIIILDNLTTFGSQQTGTEATWIKVAVAITKMVNLAKVNKVPIIIVLHVKPSTTFQNSPKGIQEIAKSDNPLKIFEESVTIIGRPSLNDVYGGGGVLSQLSGAILLWRPFQKFSIAKFRGESMLILDSMRHSESGVQIRLNYDGKSGKFYEQMAQEENEDLENLFNQKDLDT